MRESMILMGIGAGFIFSAGLVIAFGGIANASPDKRWTLFFQRLVGFIFGLSVPAIVYGIYAS